MDNASAKPAVPVTERRRLPSLEQLIQIIGESAVNALVKSMLVFVFGGIALGLVDSIWRPMTPSAPPGFVGKPEAEATPGGTLSALGRLSGQNRFLIILGVIFIPTVWVRLAAVCRRGEEPKAISHLRRLGHQLSEQWFSLIVANAFGALISATVLVWVQQFSWTRMVVQWLVASGLGGVPGVIRHLLGSGPIDALQAWWNWYGQNELRFNFWFFYLAAICDDLGIPNLKTLGRRFARRLRRPRQKAGAAELAQ